MKLTGFVFFDCEWDLKITGEIISEAFLAGIPFTDEIPGLREEVPAIKLTREIFGLAVVLYGDCDGNLCSYTLHAFSGAARSSSSFDVNLQSIDIGSWMAQLIAAVPGFSVTASSAVII
jgi:hypothetical protein